MVVIEGKETSDDVRPIRVTGAGYATVTAYNLYPDGANKMPSMDAVERAAYVMTCGNPNGKHNYTVLGGIGETTIWTPAAGKKFVLTDLIVSATANCGITIRDNTAGATLMTFVVLASTTISINLQTPIASAAADNVLTAQTSAITVNITTSGYEI